MASPTPPGLATADASGQPATDAPVADSVVEPHTNDSDSAYSGGDDDLTSYTASLTSSVLNYPFENGRSYPAFRQGRYLFPNDEPELDRLDMMHCTLQLLLEDKLHYAPIGENPQHVLDIGTGTGIWAMEFGDKYPSAQVTGNDLSPTQPEWVPPNVKFEIDDVESQWTSGLYDFIHSRYMAGAIRDWPKLLKQCYEHTAPDGYAEFHDFDYWSFDDDDSQKDTAFLRWNRGTLEGMSKVDMDPRPGPKLEQWLKDAGFVDVYAKKHKLPLGPWPEDERLKKIGAWYMLNIFEGLEGISMAIFTRCLGWSVQEVQILLAKVRADLRNPSIHVYYEFWVAYGRRPGNSKQEVDT